MISGPARAPQQGRSRASYERILAAAEELLVTHGSDDFTLTEVSKRGKVSIGSIYCRFDSKDELLHDVQLRALERIDRQQLAVIDAAISGTQNLHDLVYQLVDGIADTLHEHSRILRPLMNRATVDPVVAACGKARYQFAANRAEQAMLAHRAEIRQKDPERAVHSAYRIIFSTIARFRGFGAESAADSADLDWAVLKEDLAQMVSAFLRTASPG